MQRIIFFLRQVINENRKWLKKVIIWFIAGIFLGITVFLIYPQILEEILKAFEEKFGDTSELNFNLVIAIFFNNLKVAVIGLIGGLLFGIGPFLVVVINGFLLGFIGTSVFLAIDTSLGSSLLVLGLGLIPHGVFEIPALLLTSALGLRLGINWMQAEKGERVKTFRQDLRHILKASPLIIVLLFVAALVEVFVTGNLLK